MYNNIRLIYILIIGTFSTALFLYGFFPIMHYDNTIATVNHIPQNIDNIRMETSTLYNSLVNRTIIMVIDAFRWDFISDPIIKDVMPITNKLIEESNACLLKAKVEAPTVTMPRIKAITTGRVPTFVDVALNFGNQPIVYDNVLSQAKTNGHKIIFYGDDTWLKLFPNMFKRYDGTTSFFVTDFTEVDNNVTRHINNELQNNDWSIMILHYLGLDHIGHVTGPFSSLIKPKLTEMDNIIAKIYSRVLYWNDNNDPTLFIICGDHGMKDSGGHGGSTLQETTVPVIAIGAKCSKADNKFKKIAQLDIASTLSVMLGIPIPYSNFGSIALDLLDNLSVSQKLFALYYNAKQVHTQFQKLIDYDLQYAHHKYVYAIKHHITWLKTANNSYETGYNVIAAYRSALHEMKEMLVKNMLKTDTYSTITAMLFLCQILWILLHDQYYFSVRFEKILKFFMMNLLLWVVITFVWNFESINFFPLNSVKDFMFILSIIGFLFMNCYFLARIKYSYYFNFKLKKYLVLKWIFLCGVLTHALSLISSSYVEEEHQIWYFFWSSLLVFLFHKNIKILILQPLDIHVYKTHLWISIELFLLLIGHRILRMLNSTGNKYHNLPDIAGWLMKEETKMAITVLVTTALSLLIWIDFKYKESAYKWYFLILNIGISLCIYLRHMINNNVISISLYPSSRGITEVKIFWYLFTISCVLSAYRLISAMKHNKANFVHYTLFFLIQAWIMISALLHQPYNLILLPIQLIVSSVINSISKHNNIREVNILISALVGNVFYFYQGNSNSLADVDIAAGYVGLQSYIPLITGIFLIINTYTAPVLAYLVNMYYQTLSCKTANDLHGIILSENRMYMISKLVPLTTYTFIMIVQKHHLFIWSVFAPKLLYESMYSAVTMFTVFLLQTIIFIQFLINKYA